MRSPQQKTADVGTTTRTIIFWRTESQVAFLSSMIFWRTIFEDRDEKIKIIKTVFVDIARKSNWLFQCLKFQHKGHYVSTMLQRWAHAGDRNVCLISKCMCQCVFVCVCVSSRIAVCNVYLCMYVCVYGCINLWSIPTAHLRCVWCVYGGVWMHVHRSSSVCLICVCVCVYVSTYVCMDVYPYTQVFVFNVFELSCFVASAISRPGPSPCRISPSCARWPSRWACGRT